MKNFAKIIRVLVLCGFLFLCLYGVYLQGQAMKVLVKADKLEKTVQSLERDLQTE